MFSFRTEEGIDYLALHVEYVVYEYCAYGQLFFKQYKLTRYLHILYTQAHQGDVQH